MDNATPRGQYQASLQQQQLSPDQLLVITMSHY